MAEFPAMPLWTDAYLGDTRHLSTFEHGAYLLLLIVAWRSPDGALPDDDRLLARYAGCTRGQWAKIGPTIRAFFNVENGQLLQSRLIDERKVVKSRRESQIANGRLSALKRKERHSAKRCKSEHANGNEALTPLPLTLPTSSNELDLSSNDDSASGDAPTVRPEHVFEFYKEMAIKIGLPVPRDFSPERRALARARIAQHSLDDIVEVFGKCSGSAFLRGDKGRSPLTIDWLLQKRNFQKVLEGNYDG